jgi:hypothetical protein
MIIRNPLDLAPAVVKAFVGEMNDYFAEEDPTKRDAITAHQLDVLGQYGRVRRCGRATWGGRSYY